MCIQVVPRPSVSSTETVFRVETMVFLWWEPSSLSVMRRVSTGLSSVTGPQVTAGVWTVGGRREREPELHLEPREETVTSLVRVLYRGHLVLTSPMFLVSSYFSGLNKTKTLHYGLLSNKITAN